MTVLVNDKEVDVLPGMTVAHVLIAAGLMDRIEEGKGAYDEWGNEVGLDGELTVHTKLYVR